MLRYCLPVLLSLLLVGPALANRFPPQPHIYVTGEAVERLPPAYAELHFNVARTGADVDATRRDVDAITERVWRAAQDAGVAREDFRATGFSVSPIWDFDQGRREYRGTQVSRQYTLRLRDMSRFDALGAQLVQAGVQDVPGIRVDIDEREQREATLRVTALHNARAEAERLAAALDHVVVGVHTISDTPIGDGGGPVPFAMARMDAAQMDAPTLPDHVELRARAHVVFLIRPR